MNSSISYEKIILNSILDSEALGGLKDLMNFDGYIFNILSNCDNSRTNDHINGNIVAI